MTVQPSIARAPKVAVLVLALSAVCGACSSPSKDTGSGGGGGAGPAGDAGTGGSAGGSRDTGGSGGAGGAPVSACNALAEDAPNYGLTWDSAAAPEAQGGTFADGTYVITHVTGFGSTLAPNDAFGRGRIAITGTTWQEVEGIPPYEVNPDRHYTRSMSIVQPHFLTLTRTCPAGGGQTVFRFTLTATGFNLFHDEQGTTFEFVYTRE